MLTQLTMKWVSIVLLSLTCCSSSRIVSKSDRHCYKQFAIEHVESTDRMIYPIVFSGSSANHPYKDETDGVYTLLFNFNDKEFEKLKQGFYDFNKTIPIDTLAKNQTFYYGTFRIGIQDSCKPRKPFIFRDANAKSGSAKNIMLLSL